MLRLNRLKDVHKNESGPGFEPGPGDFCDAGRDRLLRGRCECGKAYFFGKAGSEKLPLFGATRLGLASSRLSP